MPVTQSDVARFLGVDQRTVSVAFGASGRISEKTRRRVVAAARQMGYRPNRLASGLRGGRTSSVGMIWAFANPWAGDSVIALDLLQRLQNQNLAIYQSQHSEDIGVLCRQLDDLIARRADALVIQAIPSQLRDSAIVDRIRSFGAVVAVCREDVPELECDLLIHDRDQAIREVVDHMVASGRRRLAMATSISQESNPPKYRAFVERCRHHGLPDHEHMLINLDHPIDPSSHGRRYAEAIRRQFPPHAGPLPVDAIFCFNDTGAMFVMRELQGRGLRIPEDVAVVGFNNMEVGETWHPPLATGDRMPARVADTIERMLLTRMEDPAHPPQRKTIHMRFIWRESAGGANASGFQE